MASKSSESETFWTESGSVSGFEFDDLSSSLGDFYKSAGSVVSDDLDRIEETDWQGNRSTTPRPGSSQSGMTFITPPPMHKTSSAPGVVQSAVRFIKEPVTVEKSPSQVRQLELEYRRVCNELSHSKNVRTRMPTANADSTVLRIVTGQDFYLEPFKTKEEKMSLLSTAIEKGDGVTITTVLLFLQKTLTFALFLEALQSSPIAANHYVSYLKQVGDHTELINILMHLGRREDAAMADFQLSCQQRNVSDKLAALKRCAQTGRQTLNYDAQFVTEYVDLLERQIPVDADDDKTVQSGRNATFSQFKKTASVIDQPVLITLYYCCMYHYDANPNHFGSPLALKARHQLTDKQFVWTAVKALARRQQWSDVESLLTDKSLFGTVRLKAVIPFKKLVDILSRYNPPTEVIAKYIALIPADDLKLKLGLAKTHKCHKIVIDLLVQAKDKQALIDYRSSLVHNSADYIHAGTFLDNPKITWKDAKTLR